ncbi:MAG TPA: hypothetical protein VHY56_00585 [Candidatus Binataceae bacterium]|nr:hypothetical protein [Candidatus Binataceae bacterium]
MTNSFLHGDVLSAEQYNETRRTTAAEGPLSRLMVAVFDVAWADASYIGNSQPWSRMRAEAVDWFVNPNNGKGLFSFENICEMLGYDVDAARKTICDKLEKRKRKPFMRRPPSRSDILLA